MENNLRTKEAKALGTTAADGANIPKAEHGNSSLIIVSSILLLYTLPLLSRGFSWHVFPISGVENDDSFVISGLAIVSTIFAFLLRYSAMKILGKYFSRKLGIQAHQVVVRSGPYAFVRNPGYAANMVLFLTFSLVMSGDYLIGFLAWLQWLLVLLKIRIPEEEKMLLTDPTTGDAYKVYIRDVPNKLIPFVL
eukprot:scaffold1560_cov177-Ochromonas_danica.AAC.10